MLNAKLEVFIATLVLLATLVTTTGCSNQTNGATTPAPLDVEVVEVQQRDVPIYSEWIGTLDGLVNADIKAQVTGYLLEQTYQEGSFVKKGQLLFQIDPRPFQAALDLALGQQAQSEGQLSQAQAELAQAEAQVSVAEANQRRTQLDVDRYTPLAQQQAITQQDLDNATQNNLAAKAQVQAAQAQVATARAQIIAANAAVQSAKATAETARINLGFTRLTSPIDGIPGIAQQQVGSLVSPASPTITTVSTLDPIRVYFTVAEQEYLDFHRRYSTPDTLNAERKGMRLELILADGTVYGQTGTFYFADRQVDVRTGAIRVAGLFSNPGNNLRPGQYGRVRTALRVQTGALLVQQRAVNELQGSYQIAVVGPDNKVDIRFVKVGDRIGSQWLISDGLKPGERVVAEGVQKVRQGMQVNPKPFATK
ncbi:MAG TPA: efflux RND transporter periplasmic adaptor subunit [Bryobacteraceae bacterium]|nr:efflux RND transporter periplasmic adaptor subunit [Bryobacteraceae bacterium]